MQFFEKGLYFLFLYLRHPRRHFPDPQHTGVTCCFFFLSVHISSLLSVDVSFVGLGGSMCKW